MPWSTHIENAKWLVTTKLNLNFISKCVGFSECICQKDPKSTSIGWPWFFAARGSRCSKSTHLLSTYLPALDKEMRMTQTSFKKHIASHQCSSLRYSERKRHVTACTRFKSDMEDMWMPEKFLEFWGHPRIKDLICCHFSFHRYHKQNFIQLRMESKESASKFSCSNPSAPLLSRAEQVGDVKL